MRRREVGEPARSGEGRGVRGPAAHMPRTEPRRHNTQEHGKGVEESGKQDLQNYSGVGPR